jgi:hypothetical protein
MSEVQFSQEELLSHLAHRPRYILNGVISVDESVKLSFARSQRDCQSSSIGQLDKFPLEILHATFNYLDLQSLSRLSRVSLRATVAVESLPAYRDLSLLAGHTFRILNQTKTISLHSAVTLHAALCSHRCASCGKYGAFLFLLSCERSCFACLSRNQSLWMISLPGARDFFTLKDLDLKTLPVIQSIPGTYSIDRRISRKRSIRLTSVREAKELALKVHGSSEAISRASKYANTRDFNFYKSRWLQAAPLEPLAEDPLSLKDVGNTPSDDLCGTGSVPFPSMSPSGAESGIWCRGCERTFELYRLDKLDWDTVSRLVPPGCDPFEFLEGLQYRAMSQAEFLEHAKHCHSAREVITRRWIGLV